MASPHRFIVGNDEARIGTYASIHYGVTTGYEKKRREQKPEFLTPFQMYAVNLIWIIHPIGFQGSHPTWGPVGTVPIIN